MVDGNVLSFVLFLRSLFYSSLRCLAIPLLLALKGQGTLVRVVCALIGREMT